MKCYSTTDTGQFSSVIKGNVIKESDMLATMQLVLKFKKIREPFLWEKKKITLFVLLKIIILMVGEDPLLWIS